MCGEVTKLFYCERPDSSGDEIFCIVFEYFIIRQRAMRADCVHILFMIMWPEICENLFYIP